MLFLTLNAICRQIRLISLNGCASCECNQCVHEWEGLALEPTLRHLLCSQLFWHVADQKEQEEAMAQTQKCAGEALKQHLQAPFHSAVSSALMEACSPWPRSLQWSGPPAVGRSPARAEARTHPLSVRCLLHSSWQLWDSGDSHVHTRGHGTEPCIPPKPPVQCQVGSIDAQALALPTAH